MESLVDLAPIFIIGGGLVVLGFCCLYWWYRGGTVRCIKCGKYTWEGMESFNDAGDTDPVHRICPTSAVTEESQ